MMEMLAWMEEQPLGLLRTSSMSSLLADLSGDESNMYDIDDILSSSSDEEEWARIPQHVKRKCRPSTLANDDDTPPRAAKRSRTSSMPAAVLPVGLLPRREHSVVPPSSDVVMPVVLPAKVIRPAMTTAARSTPIISPTTTAKTTASPTAASPTASPTTTAIMWPKPETTARIKKNAQYPPHLQQALYNGWVPLQQSLVGTADNPGFYHMLASIRGRRKTDRELRKAPKNNLPKCVLYLRCIIGVLLELKTTKPFAFPKDTESRNYRKALHLDLPGKLDGDDSRVVPDNDPLRVLMRNGGLEAHLKAHGNGFEFMLFHANRLLRLVRAQRVVQLPSSCFPAADADTFRADGRFATLRHRALRQFRSSVELALRDASVSLQESLVDGPASLYNQLCKLGLGDMETLALFFRTVIDVTLDLPSVVPEGDSLRTLRRAGRLDVYVRVLVSDRDRAIFYLHHTNRLLRMVRARSSCATSAAAAAAPVLRLPHDVASAWSHDAIDAADGFSAAHCSRLACSHCGSVLKWRSCRDPACRAARATLAADSSSAAPDSDLFRHPVATV